MGGDGNIYYVDIDTTRIESILSDISLQNNESHEIIVNDLNIIAENQSDILISNMLICGLIGFIIGILFVNIFKSR